MIDPSNITNCNMSNNELEEVLLFWVLAAGKKAKIASHKLSILLKSCLDSPFDYIASIKNIPNFLKENGVGCYNNKGRTFLELTKSNLNLKKCSAEDLEKIYGIGMKTSRCFIIHSRPEAKYVGLDTHILKFIRYLGYDVPKSTPNSKSKYLEIEGLFLTLVSDVDLSIADIDLLIWNFYSRSKDVTVQMTNFLNDLAKKSVEVGNPTPLGVG